MTKNKIHTDKWFAKQNARLEEPIKNTKRYYYLRAILCFCTFILIPRGIYLIQQVRKHVKIYEEQAATYLDKGRTITMDGAPGTGKTFTGSNMAYNLALWRWEELKAEYFTQRTMVTQWVKELNTDKLNAFEKLEESYIFFAEREQDFIPCLISTIPLREYGTNRMSYKLPPEVFLQIKRCPEYVVLFNDESGMLFGGETSKTENNDLKDFWRFIRHMLDAMSVNTNQDGSQNGIYMRRSTDYVNHMYGQESILHPERLFKRYERKKRRYFKRLYKGKLSEEEQIYQGQKLYYTLKYIKTIGFRAVYHRLTLSNGMPVGDMEAYILPAIGGVEYDDRAYRNYYKPKDQEIALEGWETLVLDEIDRVAIDKAIKNGAD
ncbi:MAG: hypothetical protein J6B04_05585 [Clostridia bacterium]|nr:hypothetical protein [Clostridia bacterium]